MSTSRLAPGHGWAYFGVVLGLIASVAGNIASTVLTESEVTLWLRVPMASLWTIFLGVGIEVLTRIQWAAGWKHWGARLLLIGPMSLVAAVVSWLHLNHLMGLTGEPELAQVIGPLAVDGTLFGCTVALLVTRATTRDVEAGPRLTLAQRVAAARTTALDLKAAAAGQLPTAEVPAALEPATVVPVQDLADQAEDIQTQVLADLPMVPTEDPAPVSPAPARTQRGTVDYAKVTRLVLEHQKDQDVADLIGSSPKTPQRVRRAIRLMDTTTDLAAIASTVKLSLPAVTTIQKELSNR